MKTLTVRVTQADIDASEEMRCSRDTSLDDYSPSLHCPIAMYLKRMGAVDVSVGQVRVRVDGVTYKTSRGMEKYQVRWDYHLGVGPALFRICESYE